MMSKKAKQAQREAFKLMLDILVMRFPKAFFPLGQDCKPLKIGVRDDLIALGEGIDTKRISHFFRAYCKAGRYLCALKAAAQRVDLDGRPVGEVTAEEAESAVKELRDLKARRTAQKLT